MEHSAKQMIKSKSYIGIHKHHNHVQFDSASFPIVMITGASCAMSKDINDFIELAEYKDTISGLEALTVEGKPTL